MNLFLKLFLKITLENEFEKKNKKCKKWDNNIKIHVFFQEYIKDLDIELDNIVKEINNLSETVKLERTKDIKKANLKLFFCSDKFYRKKIPVNTRPLLKNNYGLCTIFYNNNFIINKASIYIDIYRTKNLNCQKHLLREELTQSLGLVNDINMEDSIFNQKWQCITKYSTFDKLIIKFFLSKNIKPAMRKKEIIDIYQSSNL